ncbi:MAG: NUDIX domain-containing protein [Chloroflexota bacterium]
MTREHVAGGDPHPADDRLRETVTASRTVHRGHYLEVRVDDIATPGGGTSTRDIVAHPGAVAIVALDPDHAVLMVRQFRLAAGRTLLEIPAGTLDRVADGGVEDPDLAAPRELEEETGFRAGSWEHLGAFWTAPGFATELMHLYLARDLVPAHENRLGPDEDERLELEHIPWREAVAMAERGEIVDAKTLVGLLRLGRIMDREGASSPLPVSEAGLELAPGANRLATAEWTMNLGRLIRANANLVQMSRGLRMVGVVSLLFGAFLYAQGADLVGWLYPMVFGALIMTGLFNIPFIWWQARRRPDLVNVVLHLEADDLGVRISAPYGAGAHRWDTFRRTRQRGGFLFLDILTGQNFIIPIDAFEPSALATFRALLLRAGFSPDGKPIDTSGTKPRA